MNKYCKYFCLLLLQIGFILPVCGNDLYKFSSYLNQAENGFWRAIFASKLSVPRKNYDELLYKMLMQAQDIRKVRLQYGPLPRYGDLVSGSSRMRNLLENHSAFRAFRNKTFSVSGMKKTNLNEFRKVLRSSGNYSRKKSIPLNELPADEYLNFLNDTREHNLNIVNRRFNALKELSSSQREKLHKTTEDFYNTLTVLRYNWLVLTQREGRRFQQENAE